MDAVMKWLAGGKTGRGNTGIMPRSDSTPSKTEL